MLAEILEDPITVICEAPLPMCSPEVLADCFLRRVADLAPVTDQPFIAILNGEPLLRAGWGRRLIPGDELAFVLLPLGGGGGDSNPLRVVLQIVVLAVAIYTGNLAALGELAPYVAAGVAVAGNALVNAIAPLPRPSVSRQNQLGGETSPTYGASVSLAANQARLGSPIPVIYGRHIILPDFWQQPYYEFDSSSVQTYYAIFTIGEGEYDLESLQIDDTAFAAFPGVPEFDMFLGEDGTTLVGKTPLAVSEVGGIELNDVETTAFFTVCASDRTVDEIQCDFVAPRGVFFANTDGTLGFHNISLFIDYQEIDEAGTAVGGIQTAGPFSLAGSTSEPIRRSASFKVADARYQVRMRRTTPRIGSTRYAEDAIWSAAYGFIAGGPTFLSGVTYLAVKMQSSNALNSSTAQRFRAVVQRRLPVYRNGAWTDPEATRSVVWAALDLLRNPVYGAGLPDARIDLDAFLDISATLDGRRDRFDGIFDTRNSALRACQQIMRAGRCAVVPVLSQITAIRDELREIPTALFSPRITRPESLSVEYIVADDDTADGVTAVYFDEVAWSEKRITVGAPGVVTPERPVEVSMFGITQPVQAQREALFIAYETFYRRRRLRLSTELDAARVRFGDLAVFASDVLNTGHSADVVGYVSGTGLVTLSEPMPAEWDDGRELLLVYTRRDGSPTDPVSVTYLTEYILSGATNLSPSPLRADDEERARCIVYDTATIRFDGKITGVMPRTSNRYDVLAVVDDVRVYDADAGLEVPEDNVGVDEPDVVISIDVDQQDLVLSDVYNAAVGDPGTDPVSVEFRFEPGVIISASDTQAYAPVSYTHLTLPTILLV